MDEESYREAVRKLWVGGWKYLDGDDMSAIEAAAESRNDAATLVFLDLMMERDEVIPGRIASLSAPGQLEGLVDKMLEIEPCDPVWHILFAMVERDPSLLASVEARIASWPDAERRMPHAWWDRMLAGEQHEYFRLARNSGMYRETLDPAGMRRHAACFRWLTELSLEASPLDVDTLEEFLALPEVRGLKRLSLARTGLRDAHACALARGGNLANLEWLDLTANDIGPHGAAELIAQSGLTGLTFLNLTACEVTFDALARALRNRPPRVRPIILNLSEPIDNAGFAELVQGEAFSGVIGLDLFFCGLQPADAEALAQSPAIGTFRHLRLNQASLGEAGVRAILAARWIGQVEHLELFNQKAGDGIAPNFKSLSGGPIRILELLHNDLGRVSGEALGACDLRHLETLHLSYNPLGDAGAAAIFRNPTLINLTHVMMQGVGAGPETARAITENSQLRSLETLWLGDNLGAAGAELLAQAPHLASLRAAHFGGATSEQAKLRACANFRNTRITTYP